MKQSDRRILEKIVEEIDYLEGLLDGVDMESFMADGTITRAAAMASINIGELAKHLSGEFYEEHPDSELRYAARTRDVVCAWLLHPSFRDGVQDGQGGLPPREGVDPRAAVELLFALH